MINSKKNSEGLGRTLNFDYFCGRINFYVIMNRFLIVFLFCLVIIVIQQVVIKPIFRRVYCAMAPARPQKAWFYDLMAAIISLPLFGILFTILR